MSLVIAPHIAKKGELGMALRQPEKVRMEIAMQLRLRYTETAMQPPPKSFLLPSAAQNNSADGWMLYQAVLPVIGGGVFCRTFAVQYAITRMGSPLISLHNKHFQPYLSASQLADAVDELAARLNTDYAGRNPLFVVVLTGAFMFASDLLKRITEPCEIVFIRVASYEGTESSGYVQEVLGLREDVHDRHLIIVEDIVDTGTTMHHLLPKLRAQGPASVEIATLFFKPESLRHALELNYVALQIPNDFVVGYGLDYNGLGRNLPDVYVAV